MHKIWPVALLLVLLPHRAAKAEAQPLTSYVGGPFNIFIDRPNDAADGKRIDCSPSSRTDCYPLNKSACDATAPALPISFTISNSTGSSLAADSSLSRTVYAFLSTTSNCIYSQVVGQTGNNPNMLIGTTSSLATGSVFYAGGTRSFTFPNDIATFNDEVTKAGTTGVFTTREMLTALGLCSNANGTDTALGTYFLCVAIDSSNKNAVNTGTNTTSSSSSTPGSSSTSSANDPTAFLQLQADTLPPVAPTGLVVKPLNGRVQAQVRYNATSLDVYTLTLAYTSDAANLAAGLAADANGVPLGCAAWTDNVTRQSVNVYNQTAGEQDFLAEDLENDVTYGFCAYSGDRLLNAGPATAVQTAEPRFECDLFDCYPGDLATGYCGARGSSGAVWAGTLAAGLWLLRPGRRQRAGRPGGQPAAARLGRLWPLGIWLLVGSATPAKADPSLDPARQSPRNQALEDDLGSIPPAAEAPSTGRERPLWEGHEAADRPQNRHTQLHTTFGDPEHDTLRYAPQRRHAPRFGVELRLQPWRPRVGDAQVRAVYDLVYDKKSHAVIHNRPLAFGLGFEWLPLHTFGLLGPYVRLAYWQAAGPSRVCSDANGAAVRCTAETILASAPGNDKASLTFFPITLGAVWRLDPFLERLRLPLGLAVNAGLDYVLWWAKSGGSISHYGAHRAQGATLGLHLGAQLSLQLDYWLQRKNIRNRGVSGTHLFAEYNYAYGAALVGRHRSAHLDTTDNHTLAIGLGLRFF